MTAPAPSVRRPPLLTAAALVSILVLALAVTGLFALSYTNSRTAAMLARLDALHNAEVETEQARAQFKTQVQEWKNLLLRGRDPAAFERYHTQFETRSAAVQTGLEAVSRHLAELHLDGSAAQGLADEHTALNQVYAEALITFDPHDSASVFATDAAIRGVDRPLNDKIEELAAHVRALTSAEHTQLAIAASGRYQTLRRVTLAVAALAILASLTLVLLANRASRPAS